MGTISKGENSIVKLKNKDLEKRLSECYAEANRYKEDKEYWEKTCQRKDAEIDELMRKNKELETTLKSVRARNEELVYTALANAHAIDFLCNKEFDYAEEVEFAAIKYYRKGWGFMYLNGEKINAKDKNVTMYADIGEPINIEVRNG